MIKIYKLSNGDEIVGVTVPSDKPDVSIIMSPLKIDRVVMDEGIYYTLRAWFCQQFEDFIEQPVELNNMHVICTIDVSENIEKQYHSTIQYLLGDEEPNGDMDANIGDSDSNVTSIFNNKNRLN